MTSASMGMLVNGNVDVTTPTEVVPGFFLPQPSVWINDGSRTNTGAFLDGLSSEPWAGPAPTPVTTDDFGVFFKPFTGNLAQGNLTTVHFRQDVAADAGGRYELSAWVGAEANYSGLIAGTNTRTVLAMDFLGAGGAVLSSAELDLVAAGLGTVNGAPFNYKNYSVAGVAPAGTEMLRARLSMIDAYGNPAGGAQALVADDFRLVPEPASLALLGGVAVLALRRRA
jgi:hypothetical protein